MKDCMTANGDLVEISEDLLSVYITKEKLKLFSLNTRKIKEGGTITTPKTDISQKYLGIL